MNNNIFRLVFSKRLGMLIPASEMARSRSCKSPRRSRRRALAALLALAPVAALAAQPAGLVPHATQAWSNAAIDAARSNASQLTIRQNAAKAILDWQQLNLNRGESLIFDQQGNRSWAALNRIHDLNPSTISGKVQADGHLYFVNTNGIIFGEGAQISVGSLTASSLDVTDALFTEGIRSAPGTASFIGSGGFVEVKGEDFLLSKQDPKLGTLWLQENGSFSAEKNNAKSFANKSQAEQYAALNNFNLSVKDPISGIVIDVVREIPTITTATGGRVMLLGKDVENKGVIHTPDGQTILAAGEKVYLWDSADPAGLLVEVNSGGVATNLGEIVAQRGNVTLVGLAVNQQGRISASTSVRANGSIHLLARDTVTPEPGTNKPVATRGGVVTLAQGSQTVIDVEVDDKEEVLDSQTLNPSRVLLSGGVISIDGDIVAQGGEVTATAAFNPSFPTIGATSSAAVQEARIFLGEHALIDVSGLDASAPMSRNQLEIQLFSEQLKDAPILRDGPLFGQKIYVDARKGTGLTDIAPFVALKGRTIAERLTAGGTVNLDATRGDVLMADGAVIDVSGGSVTYEAGYVRESSVLYQGKAVTISEADKNTPYEGLTDVYSVTDPKWGVTRNWSLSPNGKGTYYSSYTDGSDAGTVNVTASHAVLDANFKAETRAAFAGQRTAAPLGGAFNLTIPTGSGGAPPALRLVETIDETLTPGFSAVGELNQGTQKFASGDILAQALRDETQIETGLFDNGFNRVSLDSDSGSAIVVDAAIDTAPAGALTLSTMGNVAINADITMPGGDVDISGGNIAVANGVTISTTGLYTNDTPGVSDALTAPVSLDGGDVKLAAQDTATLGNGSRIDASAGAWLQSGGQLKGGKGGNITLAGVKAIEDGQLSSHGFSTGGTLSVSTLLNTQIGGQNPGRADLFWLPERFFSQGGFSKYAVSSALRGNTLTVGDEGTTIIQPQMMTLTARAGIGALQSGASMDAVARPVLLPEAQRTPASISLTSSGALTVTENTVIHTNTPGNSDAAGGDIALSATGQLTILGDLIAPAGSISAALTGAMEGYDYDSTLSLFVGENATLSAVGHYAVALPDGSGLLDAEVLDAGSIALDGGDRAVVVLKQGSLLDVSGASGAVDVAVKDGYLREKHDGAAGTISINARNGMALDGDLRGNAAGKGRDGTLALTISGGDDTSEKGHPNGARVLTITQQNMLRADGLQVGDAVAGLTGTGAISAEQIAAGGFGSLSLNVDRNVDGDKVVLPGGLDVVLPDALSINASLLETTGDGVAQLASSYVMLSGSNGAPAVAGNAALEISADFIDLIGDMAFSGINSATLSASQDIRGRSSKAGTDAFIPGSLTTPGELIMSARQIYPVTNGRFLFEASGADSRIEVKSAGAVPDTLLSAGGVLTLKATDIVQGGTLRAPLGQISLEAANSLTLKDGSLTSVSLGGQVVPYGLTRLGGLDVLAPNEDLKASDNGTVLTAQPEKRLTLNAANVALEEGAKVDISGGGDTFAYEWIEGIGGSADILGQPGVYAVLPALQSDYAPFDYNYQIGSDLKAGDAVYLSGVSGLAAGVYTLLPGRYALQPGAFMVQTSSANLVQGTSAAQLDGSTLVSGYRTTLDGSSRDYAYSSFRITDGSIFRPTEGTISKAPSEYRLTSGNAFFATLAMDAGIAVPRLAADAGQLILNASDSLTLGADLITGKAADARGALVDIVSSKISVVSEIGADDGSLQLTASSLNDFGAESLLLGGTRTQGEDGLTISTGASEVSFANDAGHALEVSELIAVATATVGVEDGAVIRTGEAAPASGQETLLASGDGALLAVSSINDIEFYRTGVAGNAGTLEIGSGATVQAGRSLVLDSTRAAVLEGEVSVGSGGSATLGANRILLGSPDASLDGLRVDSALLEDLGQLAKVTLNSAQNLEIHGAVDIGNNDLDLTFNTSGVKGDLASAESADISARTFTLRNTTGVNSVAAAGIGTLNIAAKTIAIEGRKAAAGSKPIIGIGGFEAVNLAASGEAKLSGAGEAQINAGTTTISSARIAGATGADYAIKASGALTTAMAAGADDLAAANGLGAKLALQGDSLTLAGKVELPSGQLTAVAESGDLVLQDGASITAAAVPVAFDKYTEFTPGGSITLQADAGDVVVAAGAVLNVSGGGDADAGKIRVSAANGTAAIDGELHGAAGADGGAGGQFDLDVQTLGDLAALNEKLNSGGFTEARQMRFRTGDVAVSGTGNQALQARHVVVAADAGTVTVTGEIDATAAGRGSIGLYGGNGVTLAATADLKAVSTDAGAEGGQVEIATTSGFLDLQAGSSIDVSGGDGGDGGTVHLRAPRNAANTDLNITAVAGDITGASAVQAEGFKAYTDSSISTADFSTTGAATSWYKQAESFMKSALVNSGVGLDRLGKTGDATFTIVPGLEIRNAAGDVSLANDWTLHNWRFDRDTGAGVTSAGNLASGLDAEGHELLAGVLTLRAAGNLNLNGTLNDGFSSATLTAANTAQGLAAWSYNLVGGADFAAANVMATSRAATPSTGNVALANSKGVRTGAGDIRIAAGGNLSMGNESSVIYTAGRKTADLAGFTKPTNALYLTDGGDLDIRVQGDINGRFTTAGGQQTVNHWLFRQGGGSASKQTSWWVRPDLFKQGVATLGGGDVSISADGTITNFSASAATTARYASADNFVVDGGGDLTVTAGADINSGLYFAGLGDVRVHAGGAIQSSSNTFGTTIALMNASAEVSAVKGAAIETVFNPTMWAQVTSNASTFDQTGNNAYFLTYGADSAFKLSSLAGDAALGLNSSGKITADLVTGTNSSAIAKRALEIHPGTVSATAFSGDIDLGRLVLAPAASGNLELLAAGNVNGSLIAMSDFDVALLPGLTNPVSHSSGLEPAINQFRFTTEDGKNAVSHASMPVHQGDGNPLVIVARDGSISLTGDFSADKEAGAGLLSPKAVHLHAGRDITLDADIQHLNGNDISIVEAGRDFRLPTAPDSIVRLNGPGELLLQAGRNVSLGTTKGIVSVANTFNAALPDDGASITVLAGMGEQGANVVDYIDNYIDPTGAGPVVLQDDAGKLAEYRQQTGDAVAVYMRKLTGDEALGDVDAMAQYLALDEHRQAVFAYRHFSSELLASGKGFAESGNHERGDNAIAALFPQGRRYDGDVALFNSQIRTLRDGSIDILAPGGFINAGVPTSSGSDIGIVTELGGDIRAFAETGFQVEQSRVITQYGSDITVWVNNGDIDAGRGSKSAVSVPERVVSTDPDGNTSIEVKSAAVGSGIRAQSYDPDGPRGALTAPEVGSVALIAPRGILNASEAGIAAGNFLAVATQVIGADNIQVSGSSSGVPVADSGSLAGSLAGVSNVAADATKSATEDVARQVAQAAVSQFGTENFLPSFISVEVIGLGE